VTPKVIYIRWLDASFQASDLTADEMNVHCEIENVGFLVREADGYVSMAMGHYRPGEQWRYIQHIPKVNILEMRDYEPIPEPSQESAPQAPSSSDQQKPLADSR
jgi:hypothetical protein